MTPRPCGLMPRKTNDDPHEVSERAREARSDLRLDVGAGNGNRTRTISLGICAIRACHMADLRRGVSASDRERPLGTGLNGLLMARRAWWRGEGSDAGFPAQPQDGDSQVRRLAVMRAEPAWKIGRDACAVSCTDVVLAGGHPGAGLTAAGHCWRWRMERAWHGRFALAGRYSTCWNP